ncbi:hypothetical protein VTK56DRAFT_7219 [Thermocarpiscus australiensis]
MTIHRLCRAAFKCFVLCTRPTRLRWIFRRRVERGYGSSLGSDLIIQFVLDTSRARRTGHGARGFRKAGERRQCSNFLPNLPLLYLCIILSTITPSRRTLPATYESKDTSTSYCQESKWSRLGSAAKFLTGVQLVRYGGLR